MSISTNDLKNGMALEPARGSRTVVEFQHVKPGKGGAFVRTKLKNVRTGAVIDRTFRADEKVEPAIIDKREMQFLYREGADYVFMDNETYDQLHVPTEQHRRRGQLPEGGRHRRTRSRSPNRTTRRWRDAGELDEPTHAIALLLAQLAAVDVPLEAAVDAPCGEADLPHGRPGQSSRERRRARWRRQSRRPRARLPQ